MRHMRFEIVHLTQQKVKGVENTTGMFHQIHMDITLSVITQFEIALLMINPVRYRNTFSKLTCFCKLHWSLDYWCFHFSCISNFWPRCTRLTVIQFCKRSQLELSVFAYLVYVYHQPCFVCKLKANTFSDSSKKPHLLPFHSAWVGTKYFGILFT